MIGKTNAGGGGGKLKNTDAVLIVTVPTGSTITATKRNISLTPTMWVKAADASLDCAIYSIPASQFDSTTPWTVTATNGTETASNTVIVNAANEYDVTLEYGFVLFNYGATDYAFRASRTATNYGSGGYQIVDDYLSVYAQWAQEPGATETDFYCTTTVDASKYSTLEVEYKSNSSSTISIRSSPEGSNLTDVTAAVNAGATPVKAVLDISGITGPVYFAVRIYAPGATKNSINMYKIIFKP